MCWFHRQRWIFITRVSSIWFERRPLHEACIPHLEMWQMNTQESESLVMCEWSLELISECQAEQIGFIQYGEKSQGSQSQQDEAFLSSGHCWTWLHWSIYSGKNVPFFTQGAAGTFGDEHQRWEGHAPTRPLPQAWSIETCFPFFGAVNSRLPF